MKEEHLPNQAPIANGYHETKKHTGFLFPYNVYPCTIPDDFPSVSLHWQDTMEIVYIKKGRGRAGEGEDLSPASGSAEGALDGSTDQAG